MNGYGKQIQGKGNFEGDIYEGNFKNGEYHGEGSYYFSNYDCTKTGNYTNGKSNGLCTVTFGKNSYWEGVYTGVWQNGTNAEFDEYIKTSKNGKRVIFSAVNFFDTITHYYSHVQINNAIQFIKKINKYDPAKERVPFDDISIIIDSIQSLKYELDAAINVINSFEEYDAKIKYREVTSNYLVLFQKFFDDEFANWVLIAQHSPHESKPNDIYEIIKPFYDKAKIQTQLWESTRDDFLEKYDLI